MKKCILFRLFLLLFSQNEFSHLSDRSEYDRGNLKQGYQEQSQLPCGLL